MDIKGTEGVGQCSVHKGSQLCYFLVDYLN